MPSSNDSSPPRRSEAGTPSHWQQYLDLLEKTGVPEGARRWYVARVESFLREMEGTPVRALAPEAITAFFDKVAREGQLADWQFRQLVDAVRLLVDLADAPAGREVDWGYWSAGARELEPSHPTLAREAPAPPAPGESLD